LVKQKSIKVDIPSQLKADHNLTKKLIKIDNLARLEQTVTKLKKNQEKKSTFQLG